MRLRLLVSIVCSFIFATVALAEAADEALERLTELREMAAIPGISVAVGVDQEIVWSDEIGISDHETRAPVVAGTKFRAASISKVITVGFS